MRLPCMDAETFVDLENLAEKTRASLKNLIQARSGNNPLKALLWAIISIVKPI